MVGCPVWCVGGFHGCGVPVGEVGRGLVWPLGGLASTVCVRMPSCVYGELRAAAASARVMWTMSP